MIYPSIYSSLFGDEIQSLQNEVSTVNPSHVASTRLVRSNEARVTLHLDIDCLCQVANAFYAYARIRGASHAGEVVPVEKMHLGHDQLFMMRTHLTNYVEFFLSHYTHEDQTNLRPKENIEKARYIVGRESTVEFLRSLHSNLLDACEQNRCLDLYGQDRCRECEFVLYLLNAEIELIELQSEEDDE